MGKEKFENLFLVLIVILFIVGIPYLIYTLGSFIQIDYFGYINNWWIVLVFVILLVSIFILGGIDLEKNMGSFFLILFTCSFFILGIGFGAKPIVDMESYALLLDKEAKIDQLDSLQLKLANDLSELKDENQFFRAASGADFKSHEIVFFEPGSSELSDFNKRRITTFVSHLENCELNINGYTDDSGNKSSNVAISNERAQNVADFVRSIDQQNNTINNVTGFGDSHQLADNTNEMSRSKNRRVTIEIVAGIDEATKVRMQEVQDEMNKNKAAIKNIKEERDSLRKLIFETVEG